MRGWCFLRVCESSSALYSPSKSISDLVNVFRSAEKGKKGFFNDAVGASWKSLSMLTTADRH